MGDPSWRRGDWLVECSWWVTSVTLHACLSANKCFDEINNQVLNQFNVGLKTLLREGLPEPGFYGDLVYKFKKLILSNEFLFNSEKS